MEERSDFWERPDIVARFAEREPDHRLGELVREYDRPRETRVLDLGCAGGRNTVLLATRGFDVRAVDASAPMVAETRRRVAEVLGEEEAQARVRLGRMENLSDFSTESFDLVVSLGLLHNAGTWALWRRGADESARVLRRGGRMLVAHFSPETDLTGEGVRRVEGEPHVFEGLPGGRATLLHPAELDAEMAERGLVPEVPTTTGTTVTEKGRRVSVNALYRKE